MKMLTGENPKRNIPTASPGSSECERASAISASRRSTMNALR